MVGIPESSPFAYAPYRRVVAAQSISSVGRYMGNVATSWLVMQLSGKAAGVGVLMVSMMLPGLIAGPIGGQLIDRVHLRRVASTVWVTAAIPAVALGLLAYFDKLTPLAIYGLAAASAIPLTIAAAFSSRVLTAAVPDELSRYAITDASIPENVARILGSLLAGALIGWAGTAWTFWLIGAVSIVTAILYLGVPSEVWDKSRPKHEGGEAGKVAVDKDGGGGGEAGGEAEVSRAGLRDALAITVVKASILSGFIFALLIAPLGRLAAPVASAHNEAASSVGILAAALAIGGIAANPLLRKMMGRGASALRLMGASVLAGGIAMVACAIVGNFWYDIATFALVGAAWEYSSTTGQSSIQRGAPDSVLGRASALAITAITLASAIGPLGLGWLMDAVGLRRAIGAIGAVAIAIGAHHVWWTARTITDEA